MDALKYITPKFFTTIKDYSKDLIAGVIVAIIALPLSIALAIASGVNPEQGLYTAVVAGFFISFLGGSRVQIGGPTAAFVVIIYGIIAQYGMAGLTVATLMAGLMLIIMGLLRFGDLIGEFSQVFVQNDAVFLARGFGGTNSRQCLVLLIHLGVGNRQTVLSCHQAVACGMTLEFVFKALGNF